MVEMAGVEPASESISTGISPSAADDLSFAFLSTHQQVHKSASPLFPDKVGLTCQVFLYGRCQIPYLQVNMGCHAVQNYAANAKLLLFLAFIFNVSFLTQTGQTAARLSGFHAPVETFTSPNINILRLWPFFSPHHAWQYHHACHKASCLAQRRFPFWPCRPH